MNRRMFFSLDGTWEILLKINKNLGKLEFTDLPHEILFCQERPEGLGMTHKSIFSHTIF